MKLYVKYILQHPWFLKRHRPQRGGKQQRRKEQDGTIRETATTNQKDASSSSSLSLSSSSSSFTTGLLDTLEFTSTSNYNNNHGQEATFAVKDIHTNGFGGLQGGVQAILMEQVASCVATDYFYGNVKDEDVDDDKNDGTASSSVECTQLQISYQSTASKQVHLHAEIISSSSSSSSPPPGLKKKTNKKNDDDEVTIRVVIYKKKNKTSSSSPSSSSSKQNNQEARGVVLSSSTKIHNRDDGDTTDESHNNSAIVVSEGILTFRRQL